ncbi:MAG: transcription termination/antitermination protein NusG [Caulobacterales bacterium]|jgi:transcriptional antiterminator RfaH
MAFDANLGRSSAPERSIEGGDRWFAVRSQPRKEALAKVHLDRQGFAAYLPLWPAPLKKTRTAPDGPRPFFPSYLFVRLNLGRDRWRAVNSTIGVLRLVQFGEQPSPTPDGFIEQMMARTGADGVVGFADPLCRGDKVKVLGGPFDQAIGTFERQEAQDRVTVLLSLLAREVWVTLPHGSVILAPKE